MRKLQNTLYITTPMAYLSLDGETIVIQNEDECLGRVPLLNLENIVSFGYRGASPRLMGACAERGIGLCFLTQHGRFLARISGPVSGNVLLRTAQYRIASTEDGALPIAKMFLAGKIFNGRWSLERTLRDHALRVDAERLKGAIGQMKQALDDLTSAGSVEALMGIEGVAAKAYFSVFDQMILKNSAYFRFDGRNRRPPLDPVNALLSFTYSILGHEISGALEAAGLDPAVGFLHALRPGRASQDHLVEHGEIGLCGNAFHPHQFFYGDCVHEIVQRLLHLPNGALQTVRVYAQSVIAQCALQAPSAVKDFAG